MARGAVKVPRVLYTSTAHRIGIIIYEDEDHETRKDISGSTVQLLLRDLGGTLRTYTATIDDTGADDDDRGRAHVDLNATYHTDAGAATAQLVEDGIPLEEYLVTFRTKLS